MIVTRFNPLGRKLSFDATSYVQDGLRFQLDGIENIAYGEHSSTSTQWIDLVGGRKYSIGTQRYFSNNSLVSPALIGELGFWISFKNEETIEVLAKNNGAEDGTAVYVVTTSYGASSMVLYGGISQKTLFRYRCNTFTSIIPRENGYVGSTGASGAGAVRIFGGYGLPNLIGEVFSVRVYSRELTEKERAHNDAVDKGRFGV